MRAVVRVAGTLEAVEAEVIDPATEDDLDEAQRMWPPVLRSVAAEYLARGGASGVKIWQGKWGSKVFQLTDGAYSIQGLRVAGRVQGLVKMVVRGQAARLAPSVGKELVYVDLVEAAPWNVARYMNVLGREAVYKDVGLELLRLAVAEGERRGLEGRVGLHSIPRAEGFYDAIGMTRLGPDATKNGLVYFEFDAPSAQGFKEKRDET